MLGSKIRFKRLNPLTKIFVLVGVVSHVTTPSKIEYLMQRREDAKKYNQPGNFEYRFNAHGGL